MFSKACSGLLILFCVVILVLWPVSYQLDEHKHWLPLSHNIRITANCGKLSIYNETLPYNGSIIGIAGSNWPITKSFDAAGIYYCRFDWPARTYWTLSIPMWLILAGHVMTLFLLWLQFGRRQSAGVGFSVEFVNCA